MAENGFVFGAVSENLRAEREFALFAVNKFGLNLKDVSESLINDRELVLAAVERDSEAWRYASKEIIELCEGVDARSALMDSIMKEKSKSQKSLIDSQLGEKSEVKARGSRIKI